MSAPHATRLPVVAPGERFTVPFSFARELAEGETIVSASLTVVVMSGTDADPVEILNGTRAIESPLVKQPLRVDVADVTYGITCLATTSEGNTYARAAILPVQAAHEWNTYRRLI